MKKGLIIAAFCLVFTMVFPSLAILIEVPLNDPLDTNPDQYIVEIIEMEITEHSDIDLYIGNWEDQYRWKEWELIIYIPTGYAPPVLHTIHYQNMTPPQDEYMYNCPLVAGTPIPGYDAYYANTLEAMWHEYGTQPKNAVGDRVPVGNPYWIGYWIDVDDTIPSGPGGIPIKVTVFDECVPEPATIALLGLGGLALLRKRRV